MEIGQSEWGGISCQNHATEFNSKKASDFLQEETKKASGVH
jgi:hypothetical protein